MKSLALLRGDRVQIPRKGSSVFNAFDIVSLGALVVHISLLPDKIFDSTLA